MGGISSSTQEVVVGGCALAAEIAGQQFGRPEIGRIVSGLLLRKLAKRGRLSDGSDKPGANGACRCCCCRGRQNTADPSSDTSSSGHHLPHRGRTPRPQTRHRSPSEQEDEDRRLARRLQVCRPNGCNTSSYII